MALDKIPSHFCSIQRLCEITEREMRVSRTIKEECKRYFKAGNVHPISSSIFALDEDTAERSVSLLMIGCRIHILT
jgi:hypothetical protein